VVFLCLCGSFSESLNNVISPDGCVWFVCHSNCNQTDAVNVSIAGICTGKYLSIASLILYQKISIIPEIRILGIFLNIFIT